MKSCKEISMLVSEAQDRELTKFQSFGLRFHLFICRNCRHYSNSVGELRAIMQQYSHVDQLPDVDQEQDKIKPQVQDMP